MKGTAARASACGRRADFLRERMPRAPGARKRVTTTFERWKGRTRDLRVKVPTLKAQRARSARTALGNVVPTNCCSTEFWLQTLLDRNMVYGIRAMPAKRFAARVESRLVTSVISCDRHVITWMPSTGNSRIRLSVGDYRSLRTPAEQPSGSLNTSTSHSSPPIRWCKHNRTQIPFVLIFSWLV